MFLFAMVKIPCAIDLNNQMNSRHKVSIDKLYNITAEVMNVPVSLINDGSSPESIESWDSFHLLILIDELESTFNIKFTLDEVLKTKTLNDIKRNLNNHGVLIDG
jgi:acyl carrier protein